MSINPPNQFKFKNLQFSHNWILFDEYRERGKHARGSMFRWNKNTGYNFLSIHSQFKSLSYGARVHCQTTTDIIPERQYDRHFKDSALQRTIQHLFNFRYLHDFALCSSAIHFYTRIMLSLSLSISPFFSSPGGEKQEDETYSLQYLLRSFERSRYVADICSMLGE